MRLRAQFRILFLILAVFIVFSIVFAEILIAPKLNHECIGEENGCPICAQIRSVLNFLIALKTAEAVVLFALCLSFIIPKAVQQYIIEYSTYSFSLISLKVRYNS